MIATKFKVEKYGDARFMKFADIPHNQEQLARKGLGLLHAKIGDNPVVIMVTHLTADSDLKASGWTNLIESFSTLVEICALYCT